MASSRRLCKRIWRCCCCCCLGSSGRRDSLGEEASDDEEAEQYGVATAAAPGLLGRGGHVDRDVIDHLVLETLAVIRTLVDQ